MAPKRDRTDSVWILFEVLQICHWDGFLPSSLRSSCKHCFPALICNLGTTTKDVWKQNRAVVLPEVFSDVSNFHKASGKGNSMAPAQSAFKTQQVSLLTGDYRDIDQGLICLAVVAMLFCAALNTGGFFLFYFFFFLNFRIIPGVVCWVINTSDAKFTRIMLGFLPKHYLMSLFLPIQMSLKENTVAYYGVYLFII